MIGSPPSASKLAAFPTDLNNAPPNNALPSIRVINWQGGEGQVDLRRECRRHPLDPVSMRRVLFRSDVVAVCPEQ